MSEIRYWQLANGDDTRDFSQVCFDFGVACLGPGNPGKINENTIESYKVHRGKDEWKKIKPITEVRVGDRIVLRNGQRVIQAVGEVVEYSGEIYNHSECFNDIDGWDLQHFVKVNWRDIQFTYDRNLLTRSTMTKLNNMQVITDIESRWDSSQFIKPIASIIAPVVDNELSYDSIEQALINSGRRVTDAENISHTINKVEKLAEWYKSNQSNVWATEHEIRTFLVIPFLEALGWSPQLMGIEVQYEGKKVDIVLYEDTKRNKPHILVETKRIFDGSTLAINQAIRYANSIKDFSSLRLIVATDGLRYWLYEKVAGEWKPMAYMNFSNKRVKYTAYPSCKGMIGFMEYLME